MHKLQGHEVRIVASTETFVDNMNLGYVNPNSYFTTEGIPITRIPYVRFLPHSVSRKLRIYKGLSKILYEFQPDIIFLHGVQFVGIKEVINYVRKNKVKVFADSHTDYMNSAKSWLSKNILHKLIYKTCTQAIEPYILKFWGVTPSRKLFLEEFYGVSPEKTGLLVMGIDDTELDFKKSLDIRGRIRKELKIENSDFVIITGGKIVERKNIHLLMKAVKELGHPNIHLLVFGSVNDEMTSVIKDLSNAPNVYNLGWKNAQEIQNLFFAADIAVFPGAHSVLWEQAVGMGLPCIFKEWKGYEHVDLGGNCVMLSEVNIGNIKNEILSIYNNPLLFQRMKLKAEGGIKKFSYWEIAKRAIKA